METLEVPTNAQIRQEAIDNMPPDIIPRGIKGEYLGAITQHYLALQFKYFPLFCEETRRINIERNKMMEEVSGKSPTRYIDGKVYEGSTGWTPDGMFRSKWVISDQLKYFMEHIHKGFWSDDNKKVRDSFMKGVLRGDNYYELLNKVYLYYGTNIKELSKETIKV